MDFGSLIRGVWLSLDEGKMGIFQMTDLPEEVAKYYEKVRRLPDGRWIGVQIQVGPRWALQIGIDEVGYSDCYWFKNHHDAFYALDYWCGLGDPPGQWVRHLRSEGIRE